MTEYDVDVIVAGAGPVGLMAALQLARWGVSVRLVDAAPGPATTSRALGTHARSLEIYDQLGVLGDIAPHGTRVNAFIRHHGDRPARVDFDFDGLPTRFPYMFDLDQVVTERVLRGHAGAAGVGVEWNTRLESFQHDEDAVTAVLIRGEGAYATHETVRARYLWGCDGGHSTVRKTLELPLVGESAHSWLIADAVVHTDLDRDGVHWLFPGGGALMVFPFPDPGKWRLLDTTGEGDPRIPLRSPGSSAPSCHKPWNTTPSSRSRAGCRRSPSSSARSPRCSKSRSRSNEHLVHSAERRPRRLMV